MTHLAEVELGVLLRRHTLNLEQGGVRASVALGALVPKDAALAVQSIRHSQSARES